MVDFNQMVLALPAVLVNPSLANNRPVIIKCVKFVLLYFFLGLFWVPYAGAVNAKPSPLNGPEFYEYELKDGHFIFFLPASMKHLMPQLASDGEVIYDTLQALFSYQSKEKIRVTLTENVLRFNAYASTYAQKGIELFAYYPLDSLVFSGTQRQILILTLLHEVVHYMNLSTANHIFSWLQNIFGNYWSPVQMTWNSFLAEGLAVYFETLLMPNGRGNSSFVNMIFRSAVLEGGFDDGKRFSYSHASAQQTDIFYYPGGSTAYYFGYLFFRSLAESCGLTCLKQFLRDAGDYPFFINGYMPAKSTLKSIYNEGFELLKRKVRSQMAFNNRPSLTPYKKITSGGFTKSWPRFDETGEKIFYIESNLTRPLSFVERGIKDVPSQVSHFRSYLNSSNRLSPMLTAQASRFLFVDTVDSPPFSELPVLKDLARLINAGSGLFAELKQDYLRRMVWLEACGSENWITLIQAGFGQEVILLNKELKHLRTVVNLQNAGYMGMGICDESGQFLYVPVDVGRGKDILEIAVSSSKTRVLVRNHAINEHLVFRDSQTLAFTSDLNNYFNIYQVDIKTLQVVQITEVDSGVFYPSFSKDGKSLVASIYGMDGFDLALFNTDQLLKIKVDSLKIENAEFPRQKIDQKIEEFLSKEQEALPSLGAERFAPVEFLLNSGSKDENKNFNNFEKFAQEYSPWSNMQKNMISLGLEGDQMRGFLTSASLNLSDTLNFHQNFFALSAAPASDFKSFNWEYVYNRLPCLLDLKFQATVFNPKIISPEMDYYFSFAPVIRWAQRFGQNTQWNFGSDFALNFLSKNTSVPMEDNKQLQSALKVISELKRLNSSLVSLLPVSGYVFQTSLDWHFLENEENPTIGIGNLFFLQKGSRDRGTFMIINVSGDYYWQPFDEMFGVFKLNFLDRQVIGSRVNERSSIFVSEKSFDFINPSIPDFYFAGISAADRLRAQDIQSASINYSVPFLWFNHYLDDHIFYLGQTSWTTALTGLHVLGENTTDGNALINNHDSIKSLWASSVFTKLNQSFSITRSINGSLFAQVSTLLFSSLPEIFPARAYLFLGVNLSASL